MVVSCSCVWRGSVLGNLWILLLLPRVLSYPANECRTRDGRVGLCAPIQICRTASPEEMRPCKGHSEYYCCPRQPSQPPSTEKPPTTKRDDTTSSQPPLSRPQPGRPSPPSPEVRPSRPPPGRPSLPSPEVRPSRPPPGRPSLPSPEVRPSRPPPGRPSLPSPEVTSSVPPPQRPIRPISACGEKPFEYLIAGGQDSGEHEWPWMAAIFQRFSNSRPKTFRCGGSLISTRHVLSAAHCFILRSGTLEASSLVVRLGSHFMDRGEEYAVSKLHIHQNHSYSDYSNDIALLRLAGEVQIAENVVPVCLPPPGMMRDNLVGEKATVAGWGETAFDTGGVKVLRHVTVPILSGEECMAAYSRVQGAAFLARGVDRVICAGYQEGRRDACKGDSGGPLMLQMENKRWTLVGIVSMGYRCAEPGFPGVYTRVTQYMAWITIMATFS